MKHGYKNFKNTKQGGRTTEGKNQGELYVNFLLEKFGIPIIKEKRFIPSGNYKGINLRMKPDFIIEDKVNGGYILIESKYKQISGSDWEKIESNFTFHNHYYNEICKEKTRTIVILSGFWRKCQKNLYDVYIEYVKNIYGENCIFDIGESLDEIKRFAKFLNVTLTEEDWIEIEKRFNEEKKIIEDK